MTIVEFGASASVPVEESDLLITDIATSVKCQHREPPLRLVIILILKYHIVLVLLTLLLAL